MVSGLAAQRAGLSAGYRSPASCRRQFALLRARLPTLALPVTRTGGVHRVSAGLRVPRPAADTEPPADASRANVQAHRPDPKRLVHVVTGKQSETHRALLRHHLVSERMSGPSGSKPSTTHHRPPRTSRLCITSGLVPGGPARLTARTTVDSVVVHAASSVEASSVKADEAALTPGGVAMEPRPDLASGRRRSVLW
jgi:hypothetical protein